jgi:DNA-binding HxlR family transcriptional regulator
MGKKLEKRSPCPIACSLDVIGDKWTLLVIRDLYFGKTRFKELSASPEAPPTNILSERLTRLQDAGMIRQIAASDGTKHRAYALTQKGIELMPVLQTMKDWGLKWIPNTKALVTRN